MKRLAILIMALVFAAGCSSTNDNANPATHGNGTHSNTAAHPPGNGNTGYVRGTPAGMDHAAMESSPDADKAPFELQFIDTMTVHHQVAVEMAELAASRAESEEVKKLAADIIDEQEREMARMSKLRDQWFEGKPKAVNMSMPGAKQGMAQMNVEQLGSLKGREFDREFVRQMIPHHSGAVVMASEMEKTNSRPELKQLGAEILKSQTAEVQMMRNWLKEWQASEKPE